VTGAGGAELDDVPSAVLLAMAVDEVLLAEDWLPGVEGDVVVPVLTAALEVTDDEVWVDWLDDEVELLGGTVTETPVTEASAPDWVGSATAALALAAGADPMTEPVKTRTATARRAAPLRAHTVARRAGLTKISLRTRRHPLAGPEQYPAR